MTKKSTPVHEDIVSDDVVRTTTTAEKKIENDAVVEIGNGDVVEHADVKSTEHAGEAEKQNGEDVMSMENGLANGSEETGSLHEGNETLHSVDKEAGDATVEEDLILGYMQDRDGEIEIIEQKDDEQTMEETVAHPAVEEIISYDLINITEPNGIDINITTGHLTTGETVSHDTADLIDNTHPEPSQDDNVLIASTDAILTESIDDVSSPDAANGLAEQNHNLNGNEVIPNDTLENDIIASCDDLVEDQHTAISTTKEEHIIPNGEIALGQTGGEVEAHPISVVEKDADVGVTDGEEEVKEEEGAVEDDVQEEVAQPQPESMTIEDASTLADENETVMNGVHTSSVSGSSTPISVFIALGTENETVTEDVHNVPISGSAPLDPSPIPLEDKDILSCSGDMEEKVEEEDDIVERENEMENEIDGQDGQGGIDEEKGEVEVVQDTVALPVPEVGAEAKEVSDDRPETEGVDENRDEDAEEVVEKTMAVVEETVPVTVPNVEAKEEGSGVEPEAETMDENREETSEEKGEDSAIKPEAIEEKGEDSAIKPEAVEEKGEDSAIKPEAVEEKDFGVTRELVAETGDQPSAEEKVEPVVETGEEPSSEEKSEPSSDDSTVLEKESFLPIHNPLPTPAATPPQSPTPRRISPSLARLRRLTFSPPPTPVTTTTTILPPSTITTPVRSTNPILTTLLQSLSLLHTNSSSLATLDLSHCTVFRAEHATMLAAALLENTYCEEIILKGVGLGNQGMVEISEAMAVGAKSLIKLDLSMNSVGGVGVKSLAQTLKTNPPLKHLNLSSQRAPFGTDAEQSLCSALQSNYNLVKLQMQIRDVSSRGGVDRVLGRNGEVERRRRREERERGECK